MVTLLTEHFNTGEMDYSFFLVKEGGTHLSSVVAESDGMVVRDGEILLRIDRLRWCDGVKLLIYSSTRDYRVTLQELLFLLRSNAN